MGRYQTPSKSVKAIALYLAEMLRDTVYAGMFSNKNGYQKTFTK